MAKDLSDLKWIEDLLPEEYHRKPMFDGFADALIGALHHQLWNAIVLPYSQKKKT